MEKDKVLQNIYESSGMGIDTINSLRDNVEDEDLKQIIVNQREGYQKIHEKAKFELEEMGIKDTKKLSEINKWMIKGTTKIKSSVDKSNSHIAKMMIDGTNMGLEQLSKAANRVGDDEKIPKLYSEYKNMLQSNVSDLHPYL